MAIKKKVILIESFGKFIVEQETIRFPHICNYSEEEANESERLFNILAATQI
jgi:hypothetical protein